MCSLRCNKYHTKILLFVPWDCIFFCFLFSFLSDLKIDLIFYCLLYVIELKWLWIVFRSDQIRFSCYCLLWLFNLDLETVHIHISSYMNVNCLQIQIQIQIIWDTILINIIIIIIINLIPKAKLKKTTNCLR